jgi:molybdopterin-dependent oxidoreductase alpha subunit
MSTDNTNEDEHRHDVLIPNDADENPRVGKPSDCAGGIPAVLSTFKHAARQMGVVKGTKTLLQMNQKEGFDCPGCAWPDPDHRSTVEFCENGAKAVADEATKMRVTPTFFARHSISQLMERSGRWLNAQGRLTQPMVRHEGRDHYEPISWSEAFGLIGEELGKLDSPDEAVFYTSGRTSNEAAFLYQLFVREYGTNNLPDCSNMCHESSGVGLGEVIGVGKGTVLLEDFDKADAIFVIGQNPGTNHPRMLTALQSAARNGATIVSINPLRESGLVRFKHPQEVSGIVGKGTPLASLHLQVRINGDVALLKGIMKEMLEEEDRRPGEVLDHAFIEHYCEGFEAFADDLREESWDELVERSGVERAQMKEAARIAIEADSTIACWAMGLTQHENGVANIQEVVNFLLMRGQMGKPGAGACPVRGHSNVQGDRTMGIWDRPTDAFLDRLKERFGFDPPREHGLDTVHAIKAMHDGSAKVFVGMGGNFLSATPDTNYTAEALENCELTVQISTKLNRAHLVTGKKALILPCLGRTEIDVQESGKQFVSVENSMGVVHPSEGKWKPASEHLLSEPAIVAGMARATLGAESKVAWEELVEDYDRIRDTIEDVIDGFGDYNERIRWPGGFVLPNGARDREFHTDTGKAKFTVHPTPEHTLDDGEFLMMTIRSHDQFNTTVYSNDDRYRGIKNGRRVVMLNERDMVEMGLEEGQKVDLVGVHGGRERVAPGFRVVAYDLPRRSAGTYFPEANVLVPVDSYAKRSFTPASKSVVIRIRTS